MEGVVRFDGFVEKYDYFPDKPESEIFVDAVKAVARDWIFVTPLDNECQPTPQPVRTEVSFEIENGTPHIFVTHEKTAAGPSEPKQAYQRPAFRAVPNYPRNMLRIGATAKTYAKFTVDRDGGVTFLNGRSYGVRRSEADLATFTRAVEVAASRWRFPRVPEGEKAPWYGCFEFVFNLR
jgi:outer membrane biosynthesis protein TonB